MTTSTRLPHWDMTVVFPSLDSKEFADAFERNLEEVEGLVSLFDRLQIVEKEHGPVNDETVQALETVLRTWSEASERRDTLGAYLHAFVATDSRDAAAQAKLSELSERAVTLSQLSTRLTAWLGTLDIEALTDRSELAREHRFLLRHRKEAAQHLMSPSEEALAADLAPSSGSAWARLHGNLTSQLEVPLDRNGSPETLPMSVIRNAAMNPDREYRCAAYEAELAGWESASVPLAAALNSIKGESNVIHRKRRWATPLDAALFNNHIDRDVLDAMLDAARGAFPDFRRYLRAKARLLGVPKLAWYDLFAPVEGQGRDWDFDEARSFIVTQFGTYSEKLSNFAARAFDERWIDAEPRLGKRDGAFCMKLRKDESRILANYVRSYDGMSTLAHELGHGYHNLNLASRPVLLRTAPMTLAETASIFCQTLIKEAVLREAGEDEQLSILEASLQDQNQVVVDITSRFLFEQRVFEGRQRRELSVDELNDLMLEAQRETYGDGLDQELLHPYMWAVKGHYYSVYAPYYNYPYMFGLLFGLGLYARYEKDPEGFRSGYDDLLSSTGLDDAAALARTFDIDIRSGDFWNDSLDLIRVDVDKFEGLVDGSQAGAS